MANPLLEILEDLSSSKKVLAAFDGVSSVRADGLCISCIG